MRSLTLGVTARASLQRVATKFHHWALELAFHSQWGQIPLYPSIMVRNMAILLMADLHPAKGPKIWSGDQISSYISSWIPIHMDDDGCPPDTHPFLQATLLLQNLAPLWVHGDHTWAQILCRGPDGRPYFLEERELQWANPIMHFPFPKVLTQTIKYPRELLSSMDSSHWQSICGKISLPHKNDYSIAPS